MIASRPSLTAVLLALLLLTAGASDRVAAQSAGKVAEDLPLVGWGDFHRANIPGPKLGMRKPTGGLRLEKFEKKLANQRAPVIKALMFRRFYGLSEVMVIRPSKIHKGALEVVLRERRSVNQGTRVGIVIGDDERMRIFQAAYAIPRERASEIATGMVLNVSGVVENVVVEDWQNLFKFGRREHAVMTDMVITIHLKDVEF